MRITPNKMHMHDVVKIVTIVLKPHLHSGSLTVSNTGSDSVKTIRV